MNRHFTLKFSSHVSEDEATGILSGVAVFDSHAVQVAAWTPYEGLCEPYGGGQLKEADGFEIYPMSVRCALFWARNMLKKHPELLEKYPELIEEEHPPDYVGISYNDALRHIYNLRNQLYAAKNELSRLQEREPKEEQGES